MNKFTLIAVIVFFITGCASPKYKGTSIAPEIREKQPHVVIINADNVHEGFRRAIQTWLTKHGYDYTIKQPGSGSDDGELMIKYSVSWKKDIGHYMSSAYISVYFEDKRVSQAKYKAQNNMSMRKYGVARLKVFRMMDILFGEAAWNNVDHASQILVAAEIPH